MDTQPELQTIQILALSHSDFHYKYTHMYKCTHTHWAGGVAQMVELNKSA
jgi:hypothetical protein